MNNWISILNAGAVWLFGSVLSVAFCDITWSRRNKGVTAAVLLLMGLAQVAVFAHFGGVTLRLWYPVITHLPLALLLWHLCGSLLWSVTAVCTAYLCCQMRRWLALLFVSVFSGGELLQSSLELAFTLPLLVLLCCAASDIRAVSRYPLGIQLQFAGLPAIYYGFDYLTRVYTNWLSAGVTAAVEFMPFVCAVAYLAFTLHSAAVQRRQNELVQLQSNLALQVRQSAREIESLRRTQQLSAAYRHDMRHHLQYLDSCLENGSLQEAQHYIRTLDHQLCSQAVTVYCENTAVNLILSAFAARAREQGIDMDIKVQLGSQLAISDTDLCVLLSNALENAIHACAGLPADRSLQIRVAAYEKAGRLFLQAVNSCGEVHFANGLPVTDKPGHGMGVRSICAIVEKYAGIYSFSVEDGIFYLRLSL